MTRFYDFLQAQQR